MLIEILKTIEDHRDAEGREYYLHHILLFSIMGILSGAKTYTDLERFMLTHFDKLKPMFNLKWRRVPHFSAIRKIIIGVNSESIEKAFRLFANTYSGNSTALRHICFDGKFLNGSFSHTKDKRAFNVFQAFSTHDNIILGHICLDDKDSEINAFGEFLVGLNLQNCVVTADAMHFQKKTLQ